MNDYIRLINKAEDYINQHLDESISLDDMANHVGLSSFHFHRIFKKHSNETLKQFIIRTKMERSAIFLTVRSDLSITEIAHRYGYAESSTFNRAFKHHFNQTPLQYRKARNANYLEESERMMVLGGNENEHTKNN